MAEPSKFVEFWGPSAWHFLHAVAFNMPEDATEAVREDYRAFYEATARVLPCPSCSVHFERYIKNDPVDVTSRATLARWVYDAHDAVNRRKKRPSPSFEAVEFAYAGGPPAAHLNFLSALPSSAARRAMANPFVVDDGLFSHSALLWLLLALCAFLAFALALAMYQKHRPLAFKHLW